MYNLASNTVSSDNTVVEFLEFIVIVISPIENSFIASVRPILNSTSLSWLYGISKTSL